MLGRRVAALSLTVGVGALSIPAAIAGALPPRHEALPARAGIARPLPSEPTVAAAAAGGANTFSGTQWLAVINYYRQGSGLAPVTANPTWVTGIENHLKYMADTPATYLVGAYASLHTENPASPYFTASGADEAASSDLMEGYVGASPVQMIDNWLRAPFHAVGILRPALQQVAFASTPQTGDGGLDVISGLATYFGAPQNPVLFPGTGVTTNLTSETLGEVPSPLTTCRWSGLTPGLPLVALLPSAPTSAVSATLTGPSGIQSSANGDLCIVDSADFTTSTPVYGGNGSAILAGTNAVFLIPRTPLAPGSFTATIDTAGESPIRWSFSVSAPPTPNAPPPPAPAFSTFTRIAGQTADATASAELEHQFASGTCPGTTGTRPVIVATDATYPDALASAYLARSLQTGTLLTPTGSLSQATIAAVRTEGITQVDVVGGPLAVSTAVVSQLEALPAYACGGTAPLATGKKVQVTRIWGQSQYTTAEDIAEKVSTTHVGLVDLAGAYAGVNAQGGDGAFNDTSGSASTGPGAQGATPTAIVATGQGFQDAEAASTLAYAESLPILLTTAAGLSPQASAAITTLGIKQVVVMGGPLAVSDAVVTGLESLGVSVIRVAGQTYGDTSVQLATLETAPAATGFGWSGTGGLTVARGNGFTDGLAGAVVAADGPAAGSPEPLVLTTSPTVVGTALAGFLKTAGTTGLGGAKVTHFTVLGGTLAVTQTTINAMGADL